MPTLKFAEGDIVKLSPPEKLVVDVNNDSVTHVRLRDPFTNFIYIVPLSRVIMIKSNSKPKVLPDGYCEVST